MRNLIRETAIDLVVNPQAAGVSDPFSQPVDMQGWDSVSFVCIVSSAGATDTVSMKAMGATTSTAASTTKSYAKLHASAATVSSSKSEDLGLLKLDIVRPIKRYAGVKITKGDTAILGGVLAIRYGGPRFASSTKGSTDDLAAPKIFMPNTTGSSST